MKIRMVIEPVEATINFGWFTSNKKRKRLIKEALEENIKLCKVRLYDEKTGELICEKGLVSGEEGI